MRFYSDSNRKAPNMGEPTNAPPAMLSMAGGAFAMR